MKGSEKSAWLARKFPALALVTLAGTPSVHAAARQIGFPLIVKPACEGSSVGVTRVFAEKDLDEAVQLAAKYPGDLLMETLIEGDELTVAILGRQVLPSIHIVPKAAFYDYNAKYVAEDTQYICPGLEGVAGEELGTLSLAPFDSPGCHGWGAWDFKTRTSYLDLDEINRGHYNDLTVGLKWYWSDRIRVMFDWIHPVTNPDRTFG